MRITLTIQNLESEDQDQLLSLDIFPDMTLETVRSSIQAETQIHPTSQHIYHNGQLITDYSKTMEQLQIGDGDMLALHVRDIRAPTGIPQPQQRRTSAGQAQHDPETIRLRLLGDPNFRAEIERRHPQLASARNNPAEFARIFNHSADQERRQQAERQRQIAELNAAEFDPEAQAKIEEMIRQERVMENLQAAMEHNPEVFGDVHMLYVDVEVNGHKVKALVDSGAQATIMSPSCAEACGIMRLVDRRFAGIAKGVGTAKIVGRVHSTQVKIGDLFLACSFTVMEGKTVEMLLGLDMLKRHQATIDLANDRLVMQGTFVPFLGQADLPKPEPDGPEPEEMVQGPGGTMVGARSGAVLPPGTAPPAGTRGVPIQGQASGSGSAPAPGQAAAPAPAPAPAPAAQAPPPNLPPRSAVAPPQPAASFPEEKIQQVMALGFAREQVIQALEATGGQVDYAASMLMDL